MDGKPFVLYASVENPWVYYNEPNLEVHDVEVLTPDFRPACFYDPETREFFVPYRLQYVECYATYRFIHTWSTPYDTVASTCMDFVPVVKIDDDQFWAEPTRYANLGDRCQVYRECIQRQREIQRELRAVKQCLREIQGF